MYEKGKWYHATDSLPCDGARSFADSAKLRFNKFVVVTEAGETLVAEYTPRQISGSGWHDAHPDVRDERYDFPSPVKIDNVVSWMEIPDVDA